MGPSSGAGGVSGLSSLPAPKDEKGFLERVHRVNQDEIKLGTLAREKASSREVKDLAEMMISDHRSADERLMTLARSRKLTLGDPKPVNDLERKMMQSDDDTLAVLRQVDGQVFDQMFLSHMVMGHDRAINKVTMGMQKFSSPELAPLLSEMLPRITQHRDQAFQLLGKVDQIGSQPGVGGAGTQGTQDSRDTQGSTYHHPGSGSGGSPTQHR